MPYFRLRTLALGLAAAIALATAGAARAEPEARPWPQIAAAAKGQTVYWNAWGGDPLTNAYIAWVGDEAQRRYGITVQHVKLKDTAEAVTRVVAEKSAGKHSGGSVDLLWVNGPNLLAMKQQGLLHGPFTASLPNTRLVDTLHKRSNLIDFTLPVDGMASPWRLAQFVFIADSAHLPPAQWPRSANALLEYARQHRGRISHPNARGFMGATFLKQALVDLLPDAAVLQQPATDASFGPVSAPLWAWYEQLRPLLWREGREFPDSGQAQRQLLNDGELDLHVSFEPAEAAVAIAERKLPPSARVFGYAKGMIGNTSFVAIPYNAAHKEAAMVVADLLLEPAAQARGQALEWGGNLTVLDVAALPPAQRALFDLPAGKPGLPTPQELGNPQLEPHPSWMTRITAEWERRYSR